MRFPHFDFYPGDWTSNGSNRYLTLEEKGAHIELLSAMWNDATENHFGIPDNDRAANVLGVSVKKWRRLRKVLVDGPNAVLRSDSGMIISPRLYREWLKVKEKSAKARSSREQRTRNERRTDVERTHHEGTDERTYASGYEPLTSHLSSVISKDTTTTGHADSPLLQQAETFVLDKLGKVQLDGGEWQHLQEALALVNHDWSRFTAIVEDKLATARNTNKSVQSFNYFIERFRDLTRTAPTRPHAPATTPRASPGNHRDLSKEQVEAMIERNRRLRRGEDPDAESPPDATAGGGS